MRVVQITARELKNRYHNLLKIIILQNFIIKVMREYVEANDYYNRIEKNLPKLP